MSLLFGKAFGALADLPQHRFKLLRRRRLLTSSVGKPVKPKTAG
jgi:hypothetical protein